MYEILLIIAGFLLFILLIRFVSRFAVIFLIIGIAIFIILVFLFLSSASGSSHFG